MNLIEKWMCHFCICVILKREEIQFIFWFIWNALFRFLLRFLLNANLSCKTNKLLYFLFSLNRIDLSREFQFHTKLSIQSQIHNGGHNNNHPNAECTMLPSSYVNNIFIITELHWLLTSPWKAWVEPYIYCNWKYLKVIARSGYLSMVQGVKRWNLSQEQSSINKISTILRAKCRKTAESSVIFRIN